MPAMSLKRVLPKVTGKHKNETLMNVIKQYCQLYAYYVHS